MARQGMLLSRKWITGALVSASALALLAGCDVITGGVPQADPAALRLVNTPIDGQVAFGDAHTVDPCSLVDIRHMAGVSLASVLGPDALDDCDFRVTQLAGLTDEVVVGPLLQDEDTSDEADVHRVATLPGGMYIEVDQPDSDQECDATLVFPDDYELPVAAVPSDTSAGDAGVCDTAVLVARNAADQVENAKIDHLVYPAGSAGPVDPCRLIDKTTLASAGLAGLTPTEYPEHHDCQWTGDEDAPQLHVFFAVGDPPTVEGPEDKVVTIAGRHSVSAMDSPSSGKSLCTVGTGLHHVVFADAQSGSDVVEIAVVSVDVLDQDKVDACHAAQTLAAVVWPQLPH